MVSQGGFAGVASACFNLGVAHFNGEGVAKSEIEGFALIILAAEMGDGAAIQNRKAIEQYLGPEGALAGLRRSNELSQTMKTGRITR